MPVLSHHGTNYVVPSFVLMVKIYNIRLVLLSLCCAGLVGEVMCLAGQVTVT